MFPFRTKWVLVSKDSFLFIKTARWHFKWNSLINNMSCCVVQPDQHVGFADWASSISWVSYLALNALIDWAVKRWPSVCDELSTALSVVSPVHLSSCQLISNLWLPSSLLPSSVYRKISALPSRKTWFLTPALGWSTSLPLPRTTTISLEKAPLMSWRAAGEGPRLFTSLCSLDPFGPGPLHLVSTLGICGILHRFHLLLPLLLLQTWCPLE